MVDEVRDILIRWTADASDVLRTDEQIRADVNLLKTELAGVKAVSGETTAVLKETFRQEQLDPLITKVQQLKAAISTKEKRLLFSKEEIAAMKAEINKLTTTIQRMQVALKAGNTEINQMFVGSQLLGNSGQKSFMTAEQAARNYTIQVQKATAAIQDLMNKGMSLKAAMAGLKEEGQFDIGAINEASNAFKETDKSIFDLGNTANRVFRSIMGFIVLGILRQLITAMSELIDKGNILAKSFVDVSLAVRKLQRAGEDVSIEEITAQIDELGRRFTNFSTKELNDGMASLLILGERLNLTTDQMFAFAEAMAVAATISGVDFSEGMERGLRALSTGQTRGLVELQFAISELEVKEEAYRLGLAERGKEVNKTAKQQALYNLVIEQSAELAEDIALREGTLTGQYEKQVAAIDNAESSLGKKLLPAKIKYLEILGQIIAQLEVFVDLQQNKWRVSIAELNASIKVSSEFFKSWWGAIKGEGSGMSIREAGDMFERIRDELIAISEAVADPQLGNDDIGTGTGRLIEGVEEAGDEITEAYDDLFIKLRESIIDGNQAVEKENTNFFRKLLEAAKKYALKVKQLTDKLAFDRAKVERDFQDKVSDINEKARKKEIDAEEKYQRKLRELRRKFLLDLEDALQERDAKQILRLIRDYNSRKDELGRQRQGERKDEEQERLDQLENLRKQRDRRLRELDIEYKFRRAKMKEEFDFENKLDWERHNQKLQDLEKQTDERNDEILRRFSDEYDITDEWATIIGDRLNSEFGPGGRVAQIYDYMLQYASAVVGSLQSTLAASGSFGPWLNGGVTQEQTNNLKVETPVIAPPNNYFPRQPETPPPNTYFPRPPSSAQTQIEVVLSPDLEARVINQTKSDIAEVFIRAS